MVAPLFDSYGELRYYLGAQIDVTQMVRDGVGLESLREINTLCNKETWEQQKGLDDESLESVDLEEIKVEEKDVFQGLVELFNDEEIQTAKEFAGRLHQDRQRMRQVRGNSILKERLLSKVVVQSSSQETTMCECSEGESLSSSVSLSKLGNFKGVYKHARVP
jgi:hypothetical protein